MDFLDGLLPRGGRPNEATVVGEHDAAVVIDHVIEDRQDLFAVHPVKRATHGDQPEVPEIAWEVCRAASGPGHVRDAVRLGLSGGFGEHLGLGVHADGFSDALCERESQLAGAAAQVEQAPGAVEVELPGDVVDERLRIAWPISCVVPGGSCEQIAV